MQKTLKCLAKPYGIRFRRAGTYKFQALSYGLKFVYNNTPVWQHAGSNVPFMVSQGRDQTFEMALKTFEKVDYGWFGKVELPKFLQKPSGNGGKVGFGHQQSGFGLGQSQLTTTGVR